ncbi:hypothetical protein OIU85_003409 [Salix viminalis]|uniref:Potassium transporter n=1 Tax=Salix viminalis TaxID=40686 RepID=A0A9Q0PZ33_SALVM|nr:hypothetical protein OIU85_003409 [Salix viminalis]
MFTRAHLQKTFNIQTLMKRFSVFCLLFSGLSLLSPYSSMSLWSLEQMTMERVVRFALYSLICRHANVSLLPNRQVADEALSTYKLENAPEKKNSSIIKMYLEKHRCLHTALLILVLLGTCMVIGDGILTPAISVFSAVSGLELSMSDNHHQYKQKLWSYEDMGHLQMSPRTGGLGVSHFDPVGEQVGLKFWDHSIAHLVVLIDDAVVPITCFILVCLFALQHYGTHRVGFLFAPVVLAWLLCISALGLYNIIHWNPHVYQALSPYYMYKFLKKTKKGGWMSLGGILLCITGSEAMFADLGHFSYAAIQIAFTFLVYPALILAYMGQAAYLSQHHDNTNHIGFYISVPEKLRIPVLIIAILASVVGSQAIISGTFSIINQSQSLSCFPRVKVVHTSDKIHGQIYVPEINWMLMILCVAVTIGFRDTKHMGNASGKFHHLILPRTMSILSLNLLQQACHYFILVSSDDSDASDHMPYIPASLTKFTEGAWLPILLALFLMTVMFVWHYATIKKYEFDLHNKVSLEWLLALGSSLGIARVPGIGLVFTDLTSGIPANFSRFVTNLPAFHRVLVFVCVKSVPVPYVPPVERYLVGRVGPPAHRSYRCIVRYGYRDVHQDVDSFETELVARLADFIKYDWHRTNGTCSFPEDNASLSNESPTEYRLAVIGTVSFSGMPAYEVEESVQPASVSGGFPTVDSVTDVIEMEPVGVAERRVRFGADDEPATPSPAGMDLQVQGELEDLLSAQQAGGTAGGQTWRSRCHQCLF